MGASPHTLAEQLLASYGFPIQLALRRVAENKPAHLVPCFLPEAFSSFTSHKYRQMGSWKLTRLPVFFNLQDVLTSGMHFPPDLASLCVQLLTALLLAFSPSLSEAYAQFAASKSSTRACSESQVPAPYPFPSRHGLPELSSLILVIIALFAPRSHSLQQTIRRLSVALPPPSKRVKGPKDGRLTFSPTTCSSVSARLLERCNLVHY